MRRLALVALVLLGSCGERVSPDLAPAREAARARAEATEAAAREACRARGEEVFEFGGGEWLCGAALAQRRQRAEAEWQERCAARGERAYRGGPQGWFCASPTADAGRECRAAADCQGPCILPEATARQGTCAATTTVIGCFARIGPDGRGETVCID